MDAREYDQHFIERFGEPAEGNDWGLGAIEPIMPLNGSTTLTRAGSGSVNTNRNQRVEFVDNSKSNGYKESALAHDIQVPEWPNFDGYYYASGGEGALKNIYSYDELPNNGSQPVGDVTEYEIQYVSAWFRQYGKGSAELEVAKVELHLTDFFIQNVSCDNDQREYRKLTDGKLIGNNGDNVLRASDGETYQCRYPQACSCNLPNLCPRQAKS